MQLTRDLRGAAALLKALEDKIAALAATAGSNGSYTAPGAFLLDLFASIGLQDGNHNVMADLLDRAGGLLGDEAAAQGRRCAIPRVLLGFAVQVGRPACPGLPHCNRGCFGG